MKHVTDNILFQKFRKERRYETTTTTTTKNAHGDNEYSSKQSSSHEEYNEQQFHGGGNGDPKSLHYTQSLQDTFDPQTLMVDQRLSKEFPQLQREPRHYQPRHIREEQKEFSEQSDADQFLRRQQQKLYELREELQPKPSAGFGCDESVSHMRTLIQKRTTERQQQIIERKRHHASLPPLDRFQFPPHQTRHELVLDRCPPQLVQSVHQQADAAERVQRADSRGFSPFPVFGPFMVTNASSKTQFPTTRQQSVPPRLASAPKRTSFADEMSTSMTTTPYKFNNLPQQPFHRDSFSGDEWQSAYEFLPQRKHSASPPKVPPKPKISEENLLKMNGFPEENIHRTIILSKFNAYSRQLATKCIVPIPSWYSTGMCLSLSDIDMEQFPPQKQELLNESTTFSERQANEEVRNLMGTSGATLTSSTEGQKEVGKVTQPQRQQQEPVRVEFTGPVHFLHATNLNVNNPPQDYNKRTFATHQKDQFRERQLTRQERDQLTISPPVERYIDSVCDFGPIFAELGQNLREQQRQVQSHHYIFTPEGNVRKLGSDVTHLNYAENAPMRSQRHVGDTQIRIHSFEPVMKRPAFSYRIDSDAKPVKMSASVNSVAERPPSAPYLVQSTAHCLLARVAEITQEWRLDRDPQCAECRGTVIPLLDHPETERSGTSNWLKDLLGRIKGHKKSDSWSARQQRQNEQIKWQYSSLQQPTKDDHPATIPGQRMYRTQSMDRRSSDGGFGALRRTLTDVAQEQALAREYSAHSQNAEAERIERAILDCSEVLQGPPQEPISRAQAEAKEELLRVRLAQLILNLDPDNDQQPTTQFQKEKESQDYNESLREPILVLRDKLQLLEHRLVREETDALRKELRSQNVTPQSLDAFNARSIEIARMTPLIGMLRHKLSRLDERCARQTQGLDERGASRGRTTPYAERKTVHELLVCISREIETIHGLCRRDQMVRDRLDAVLGILKRVAASVDQITTTLDLGNESEAPSCEVPAPIVDERIRPRTASPSKLEQAIEHREAAERKRHNLARELLIGYRQEHQQQIADRNREQMVQDGSSSPTRKLSKQAQKISTPTNSTTGEYNKSGGPFFRIIEEKFHQPEGPNPSYQSVQRVHAVEMSAHFACPAQSCGQRVQALVLEHGANAADPTRLQHCELKAQAPGRSTYNGKSGGKDRAYERMKRRFEQQPPRIVQQQQYRQANGQEDPDQISAFKFGACPPSYLPREDTPDSKISAPHQFFLNVPTRKFLQLQQQHYICSSQDEDEETASSVSGAMDNSSLSVPILFQKRWSASSEPARETAILSDEEVEDIDETITETFFLRRRRKHAVLNAIIYPEIKARVRANFKHGNDFEVEVERVSECGRDSVVMVSEEFYDKRVLIRSGSPVRQSTIMEEEGSSDEGQQGPTSSIIIDAHTKMAVSISARSERDSVHVFLEEIPCGQIGLQVQAPATPSPPMATLSPMGHQHLDADGRSARSVGMASSVGSAMTGRDSIFRQVNVSEGGDDLEISRSLRSSRISSQKSLVVGPEGVDELDDIPAYVIKIGSTASITCELNSDCVEQGAKVEWFRGQNEQIFPLGNKFERISGEWVEILVIGDVQAEDGQLYSVKINGELYPVAYLIVEERRDDEEMETSTPSGQTVVGLGPRPNFLTAPQTQFVLQGETAILSVQMNRSNLNVVWHKDGHILDDGRPRIWLESTTSGWYRIIINDVQFTDQGYYFAQIGQLHTNVQLIVEERIDEREVQVSSAETDDEELGDYLVPLGSTATIACELENVTFGYKLHWQRNHKDLDTRIASGDGKFEHVINGTKHYLIIHSTQPEDSGVYSVRIGDSMFKVAQITIGEEQGRQSLFGSRIRRISSQSLNKLTTDKNRKTQT